MAQENEKQTTETVQPGNGKQPGGIVNPLVEEEVLDIEKPGRIAEFFLFLGVEGSVARIAFIGALVLVFFMSLIAYSFLPPRDFPTNKIVTIKKNMPLGVTAEDLKEKKFVRSTVAFKLCVVMYGGDKKVGAGDYLFDKPFGACTLASRITKSMTGIPAYRAIVPEGMTNKEIAALLEADLPKFDSDFFMDHARSLEGYLFPDTYFFELNYTALDVERVMKENFDQKLEPLTESINKSKHPLRDIVVMASILEKEARTPEDMALVSGVLWKRIARGMPLQVDASLFYLLGKTSSELTQADLQVKSAYNTYRNKGLPAGPIGNPGLVAIQAAITPTESPYLYYLSDKEGAMHYARTFEEHKANKEKYLR